MIVKCQGDNPFASNMMQYLYGLNESFVPEVDGALVDVIMNLLMATKNVRYGPKPSIEGQYRMRQIVKLYVSMDKPIPVLVPWGSIKADFSPELDISEVIALSTLADLNKRIRKYYTPGLDINIRIEDWSGIDLFQLEQGFSKEASWAYCDNLETLINMMGEMNPKRESKMANKDEFYARASANTTSVLAYLIESKDLIKVDPSKCLTLQSYKNLRANGWKGIISDVQREHYLRCYRGLYDGWDEETMLKRLALYFGGSLARFQLEMTGANHEWGNNYIQMTFVTPVKGTPEGHNDNYLYYRTIPMNQCRTHHAPWRAKGYFLIEDSGEMVAKLCTFNTQPNGLEVSHLLIEGGNNRVSVRADYLI